MNKLMIKEAFRREIQQRGLDILCKHKGGFQFTTAFFPYTSGEIGPYYVQSGVVQNDGEDYEKAIDDMSELICSTIGAKVSDMVISGGETRDWIFSLPIALQLCQPHVMLYKPVGNDLVGKTVGADIKGKEVIHVADLNNEGSSPRDLWVPAIKAAGGTIKDIFFYVDRMEDGVKVMEKLGLHSEAVVPLDSDAWEYLQKKGVVNPEVYKSLMTRMEDKDKWARKMLRNHEGLETLAALLASGKNRDKGKKILATYEEIRDEVVEGMKRQVGQGVERWL